MQIYSKCYTISRTVHFVSVTQKEVNENVVKLIFDRVNESSRGTDCLLGNMSDIYILCVFNDQTSGSTDN